MAQATLNASVVLFGRVDNSIGKLGSALVSIGGTIDQMSQKLIDFGKESAQVYRDYEDSLLDAQVALSTIYGRNTRELSSVMKDLTVQTTEWAATTIFHTNDVADAVAKAAHAGWDEQKILSGIPAAMELAQAGGLDLSQSVDYIIKSTNAAGISFGDLTDFIDEWTYAANRSAGDVESFGEAMTRMGSTMRFADNRQELLTMLAVLHDAGTTGSDAGTLLRNSMIRLVAPTQKATDAMAELGVTQADIDEAMGEVDGDAAGAVRQLEALGFSAYDSQGNLKDFLTIFRDLGAATKDMSEDERYNIWSSIFPTRTITGAMALMNAAMGEGFELYDMLTNGAAEGYGRYASETMMSGMTGAVETLLSKWERLQQVTGANMAPQIEEIAGALGKVIDVLAAGGADNGVSAGLDIAVKAADWLGTIAENAQGLDPATFDGIAAALGVVAGMGPALLAGGFALSMVGKMFASPMSMIILASLAMVSVAEAVAAVKEANFKEAFGTMDLDTAPLIERLTEIKGDFDRTTASITNYRTELKEAVDAYDTSAQDLSSQVLNSLLLGTEYDDPYNNPLIDKLEAVMKAANETLNISTDAGANFWMEVFGEEDAENPILQNAISLLDGEKEARMAEMEAIGNDLRGAIVSALSNDGVVDEAEAEKIRSYMRELARIQTEAALEAQREEMLVEAEKTRLRSETVSYDAMNGFIQDNVLAQRDQMIAQLDEEYLTQLARLNVAAREQGISDAEIAAQNAALEREYNGYKNDLAYSWADQLIAQGLGTMIAGSDFAATDAQLGRIVDDIQAGALDVGLGAELMRGAWGGNQANMLRLYEEQMGYLGGADAVQGRIDYYRNSGNYTLANQLEDTLNKYKIASMGIAMDPYSQANPEYYGQVYHSVPLGTDYGVELFAGKSPEDMLRSMETMASYGRSEMLSFMEAVGRDDGSNLAALQKDIGVNELAALDNIRYLLQGQYDFQKVHEAYGDSYATSNLRADRDYADYFAAWQIMNMGASERAQYQLGGSNAAEAGTEMKTTIEGELNPVDATVAFPNASSEASGARSAIEQIFSTPIIQHVQIATSGASMFTAMDHMASGGRKTEPAIFAEAGPEWFIPEAHTRNTAALLLGAARASGFSLAELAAMGGASLFADGGVYGGALDWGELSDDGGNGGSGGSSFQVQYSPVIHADNAEGVESVLLADKKRLERWFNEWWSRKELYESVVQYT